MLAADVADDRFVERVARDLDGFALHHAAERDDRDLGRAAADIDDEMSVRPGNVDARTGGRGNSGFHEIHFTRAGFDHGVDDVALLHAGDAARHGDEHARLEQAEGGHARQKLAQHGRRHVVVRDHAGADRMNGHDVGRSAAEHLLRVLPDLQHTAGVFVHRDDGRLAQHNALAADVHQNVARPHVNGDITFKNHHKAKLP